MAAFSYKSSANGPVVSSFTSTSVTYPTSAGAPAVGDPLFLVLQGRTGGAALSWAAPAGWTEIGTRVEGLDGSSRNNVVQVFWKVHDAGTSVSVAAPLTGSGSPREFQAQLVVYSGSGAAALVGTPADEVSAVLSSFQPSSFDPGQTSTVISIISLCGAAGGSTPGYSTANGFSVRRTLNSTFPAGIWGDEDVVGAGSVSMPVVTPGGSFRFLAKTFALDRQLSGWSVGQIKY